MENQPVTTPLPRPSTQSAYSSPLQPISTAVFGAKPPPFLKSTKFKLILFVAVIITIGLIGKYLYDQSKQPKPAAQVGSERITIEDVQKFVRDCDIAQNEAVDYLVDEKVLTKWAKDEKITISPEDLKAEEIRISGMEARIGCVATEAKTNLLREKLSQFATSFREGKFIVVNFGRYNPTPFGIQHEEATSEAARTKLRNEDRQYADSLVNSVYSDLKDKKLTFDQAIEKVNNDKRVGKNSSYTTSPQSGPFNSSDYIQRKGLLSLDEVKKIVDGLDTGKFSEPSLLKTNISKCQEGEADCQPTFADSLWIIAIVDRINDDNNDPSRILEKTRGKYDAKIYIK